MAVSGKVQYWMAEMMRWRRWWLWPATLFIGVVCFGLAVADTPKWALLFHLASLALVIPVASMGLVLLYLIFRTGEAAFGIPSAIGYTVLGLLPVSLYVIAAPFCLVGLFTVPIMIRTDVDRLLSDRPR